MDIPNPRGRESFWEVFLACADANNSQGQIIEIHQLFFPLDNQSPPRPLASPRYRFTQKQMVIIYFCNPDN